MRALIQSLVYFGAGAVIGALILVGLIWSLLGVLLTPPLRYDQDRYTPERAVLCPGETLAYTNTLTIERPALIVFTSSWHEARSQRPVGPEDTLHPRVFTQSTQIGPRRRTNTVPDLAPGAYEYHFAAGELGGRVAIHTVPLIVADCAARPHE